MSTAYPREWLYRVPRKFLSAACGWAETQGKSERLYLDDVAIWNVALTPAQIKALADGTATPLNVLLLDPSRSDKNEKARLSGASVHGATESDRKCLEEKGKQGQKERRQGPEGRSEDGNPPMK